MAETSLLSGVAAAPEYGAVGTGDADLIAFVVKEARLADEARYSEWEALWDHDGLYWVPMGPDADPETDVSYIYDNRARIRSRIAQLNTGARHSQTPPSVMRRLLSNFETVAAVPGDDTITVAANFVLFEYRFTTTTWAGRYLYRIRRTPDGLRLAAKTVHLVNAGGPLPTMAFLI